MINPRHHHALAIAILLLLLTFCTTQPDAPDDGSVQLFYDINIDGADTMGLKNLTSIEIMTTSIVVKLHDTREHLVRQEYVLDTVGGIVELQAQNVLNAGNIFPCAPGFISQLRIYFDEIKLNFKGDSSVLVRLPSGDQTGWKIVIDEQAYPNGYEVKSGEVTGILVNIKVAELFHYANGQGWMARPTIESKQYNILNESGYEPNKIVVVFDPATSQSDMDNIISGGNFTVDFRYPKAPQNLYKLHIPPNWSLRNAYDYLRSFISVWAAAPSVRIGMRQAVPPNEGTPPELDVLGANTGWAAVEGLLGTIGTPNIVIADVNYGTRIEHQDLWENIWLNQGELCAVCGDVKTCDPDGDGIITIRDFNNPNFPPALRPPDWNGDGRISADDILQTGGPGGYVNGIDDDGNGFVDDLAGWNFDDNSNTVVFQHPTAATANHETGVAGILGAVGNNGKNTAGVTWNCRIMPIVAYFYGPATVQQVKGATDQLMAAFRYAVENGAHVVNLSAGVDIIPSNGVKCLNSKVLTMVDKTIYNNVVQAMNDVVRAVFADFMGPTPLFVLAGGECSPGVSDASSDYYDWPPEAFGLDPKANSMSITVAATANSIGSVGPLAGQSNFGMPFGIAAPGIWTNMLNGTDINTNNYSSGGTSFAAPVVSGIAALIASGNLATYTIPNGVALKADLLAGHTSGTVSGIPVVTMTNLP